MRIVMSAYSEEALVYDEGRTFIYSRATDHCRDVSSGQLRQWLRSHGELRSLDVSSMDELQQSLGHYADCRSALRLALYSIDSSLSSRVRELAIEELHPLLNQEAVRLWIEDLLYLQALPVESIKVADETLGFAKAKGFTSLADLIEPVLKYQSEIHHLSVAWDEIEKARFLGDSHTEILENVLGTGLFKKIARERKVVNAWRLAQAVSLKARVSIDSETRERVGFRIPLNCKETSNLIGFSETLAGIEHFNFWESALAENNIFMIGCNDVDRKHRTQPPVRRQDLVVKLEGQTELATLPENLYNIVTVKLDKELDSPKQRFAFDCLLRESEGMPDIRHACEKLSRWGKSASRGICNIATSIGSSFQIGK